jgi:hypothetical protein
MAPIAATGFRIRKCSGEHSQCKLTLLDKAHLIHELSLTSKNSAEVPCVVVFKK